MRVPRSTPLLALGAALGVAIAAIFLVAGHSAAPPVSVEVDRELRTDVVWPDRTELTADSERLGGTSVDDGTADRAEFTAAQAAGPQPGPLLTVVRGSPPVPAPSVEVAWIGRDDVPRRRGFLPVTAAGQNDTWDLARLHGTKARTARDGTLQLPPIAAPTVVAVADGGDFAATVVGPGVGHVRLHLVRDETLQILVLDEQGDGSASVPVAVFHADGARPRAIWRGRTDAAGRATLRHIQTKRSADTAGERFFAAVTVPQHRLAMVEFDAHAPPSDPLTLVLRPTVPLRVTVTHGTGAPVLANIEVLLRPRQARRPTSVGVDQLFGVTPRNGEPLIFPHVGHGLELLPHVRLPGRLGQRVLRPWTTPRTTDRAAALELHMPDDVAIVAARFVTSKGEPLNDARIVWSARSSQTTIAGAPVRTLADGQANLLIGMRHRDPSRPLELTLRATEAGRSLGGTVSLGTLRPGERRDLGERLLLPEPLIVRGIVRDDLGASVTSSRLRVQTLVVTDRGERWDDVPLLHTRSAADGAFAFFGPPPRGFFRVFAHR